LGPDGEPQIKTTQTITAGKEESKRSKRQPGNSHYRPSQEKKRIKEDKKKPDTCCQKIRKKKQKGIWGLLIRGRRGVAT